MDEPYVFYYLNALISGNLQSFGHLPDDAAMSIRLIYDDDAPEDYNPVNQNKTFSKNQLSQTLYCFPIW